MGSPQLDRALVKHLYARAKADRWALSVESFTEALERSASRAFGDKLPGSRAVERYLKSLHLEDLALACACASGNEAAWEHFVREQRPALYRAADQVDPTGGAREIADSLYADLYGFANEAGDRKSLFRYFHGRSSVATWLRAVLVQKHVDRLRAERRVTSLPDEDMSLVASAPAPNDPDRARHFNLIKGALVGALSRVSPRDRFRLGCYYAQELTLAQIGRVLKEHEATVCRHLARTRRVIRAEIERDLREKAGLSEGEIADCFSCALDDAGTIDLSEMLGLAGDCEGSQGLHGLGSKKAVPDRS
jgi:RNA polymerase sigma-70 factor, ECF subfamily